MPWERTLNLEENRGVAAALDLKELLLASSSVSPCLSQCSGHLLLGQAGWKRLETMSRVERAPPRLV
jgi:hypothetical protein